MFWLHFKSPWHIAIIFPHSATKTSKRHKGILTHSMVFPFSGRHKRRAPLSLVDSIHSRVFTGDFRSDRFLAVSVCFPFTLPFSADRQRLYIQDTSISSPAPAPIWRTVKGWMRSNFWGQHASRPERAALRKRERERERPLKKPAHYLSLYLFNWAHSPFI